MVIAIVRNRAWKKLWMFEPSFICCAFEFAKFYLRSFAATATLMFVDVHLCILNMWLIIWACSSKVEAVLLATSVSFLSPAMLNPSRNSDRNKTSICYKAIIQLFIAYQSENNINKRLLKTPSKLTKLFWTKLQIWYWLFVPALVCNS